MTDHAGETPPIRIGSKGLGEALEADLRRQLVNGETAEIELLGYSLFPVVLPHSVIVVVQNRAPKVGDLVVLPLPGGLATHFVVDIDSSGQNALTRGAFVPRDDGWTPVKDFVGMVVEVRFGPIRIDATSWTFRTAAMSAIGLYQRHPNRMDEIRVFFAKKSDDRRLSVRHVAREVAKIIATIGQSGGRRG